MSEYTPTTGDVEHYYEFARDEWNHGEELTGEQYRAEFARWLAAHDRQVQAEALREAAVAMRAHKDPGHWNLRDERDPANASQSPDAWIEVRADRIEKGEQG